MVAMRWERYPALLAAVAAHTGNVMATSLWLSLAVWADSPPVWEAVADAAFTAEKTATYL